MHSMTAAQTLMDVRRRSGLGLRELARRAGTSHATLHAYERGIKEPRMDTVLRVAEAAGFTLELSLAPRPDVGGARVLKGQELAEALSLAAAFPARHRRRLEAPIFGAAIE
jgi:transcriptional regulator with XRE-family HTH domain